MSSALLPTCSHGLRPGTSVCLHCRHEARAAARKRRYKLAARMGLAATGVAVVISAIVGGVMAIAPEARSSARPIDQNAAGLVTLASAQPAARAASAPRAPRLEPSIAEGRRELWEVDSVFAVREGLQVTVHFDTDTLRTRFDRKFERIVRATLPLVFGAGVRQALDSVPAGTFVQGGDLLTELPTRGITLALSAPGQALTVWPITRAGRDGLIVVAYRAATSSR